MQNIKLACNKFSGSFFVNNYFKGQSFRNPYNKVFFLFILRKIRSSKRSFYMENSSHSSYCRKVIEMTSSAELTDEEILLRLQSLHKIEEEIKNKKISDEKQAEIEFYTIVADIVYYGLKRYGDISKDLKSIGSMVSGLKKLPQYVGILTLGVLVLGFSTLTFIRPEYFFLSISVLVAGVIGVILLYISIARVEKFVREEAKEA